MKITSTRNIRTNRIHDDDIVVISTKVNVIGEEVDWWVDTSAA